MHRSFTKTVVALATAGLSLGLGACGDDDDTAADELTAYCEFSASLDEGEELPSDEEFEQLADLAPDDIASQVETVVSQIQEEGEAVFADETNEEFFEALEEIESYEEANCGRDDPDTEETPETDE